jgi:hypothetical protein
MPVEQQIAGDVAPASTDTDSIPLVPQTLMDEPTADRAPTAREDLEFRTEDREFRTEDRQLPPVPSPEPEPSVPPAVSEEQTTPTEQRALEPPDTDRSDQ